MPSYNHGHYIDKAIKSVINQSYSNWELIIIDNSSTDDTRNVVSQIKDERIIFLEVCNDGIVANSRNIGIDKAKGEWLAFLDADDIWYKNKLEECSLNFNDGVNLLYHNMDIIWEAKKIRMRRMTNSLKPTQLIWKSLILNGNFIVNSSVVVRKSLVLQSGKLDENKNLIAVEDYDLWIKIGYLFSGFRLIKTALGQYREHANSLSKRDMSVPHIKVCYKYFKKLNENEIAKAKLYKRLMYVKSYHYKKNKKYYFNLLFCIKNASILDKIKIIYSYIV